MAQSGKPLTDHDRERVQKLRAQGVSVRQIASREMVSPTTVQKILKSNVDK